MADNEAAKPKVKRKRTQTVRERTQVTSAAEAKPRHLRRTARTATRPIRAAGRGVKKVARPLAPIAKPFKTRPMRFTGRVLATVLLIRYIRNSWRELRQVSWPGRKETFKLTIAVFAFAVIFGLTIAVVDYGLDKLFRKVLLS